MRGYLGALRLLVTVSTFLVLFRLYDVGAIVHRVASLPPRAIGAAIALFIVNTSIFVYKWHIALPASVNIAATSRAYLTSLFYSLLPTGPIGAEAGKLLVLTGRGSIRDLAASIVFDKLTGLIALSLIGLIAWSVALPRSAALDFVIPLFIAILGGMGLLCVSRPVCRTLERLALARTNTLRLFEGTHRVLQSLSSLVRVRHLVGKSIFLGIIGQAAMVAIYVVLARAAHIQVAIPDLVFAVVLANVASLVPIALAGIGVREVSLVFLLSLYDVPPQSTIALSLVALAIFLLGAVIGAMLEIPSLITWATKAIQRHSTDTDAAASSRRDSAH